LGLASPSNEESNHALKTLLEDLELCSEEERPFYLLQYANLLKNKQDLL